MPDESVVVVAITTPAMLIAFTVAPEIPPTDADAEYELEEDVVVSDAVPDIVIVELEDELLVESTDELPQAVRDEAIEITVKTCKTFLKLIIAPS